MEKPIHVLHVLGGVGLGGAESRIMDLYRQMDREEIQFDFLVHDSTVRSGFREARRDESTEKQRGKTDERVRKPQFYDEEIQSMGGHIYVLPKFKGYNYFSYRGAVRIFLRRTGNFGWCRGI